MAAVTERLQFASAVQILPLHNPFYLGKAFATLAHISGNRVALGAGAGWMHEEFAIVGQDFDSRGARFDEAIALLRALWSEDPLHFDGDYFRCPGATFWPLPERPIAIYTGGRSGIALRRAARLADGWIATGEPVEESLALMAQLQDYRREFGREQQPFRAFTIQPWGSYGEAEVQRLEQAGYTDIVNWTFKYMLGSARPSLQQCLDYLGATGAAIRQRFPQAN